MFPQRSIACTFKQIHSAASSWTSQSTCKLEPKYIQPRSGVLASSRVQIVEVQFRKTRCQNPINVNFWDAFTFTKIHETVQQLRSDEILILILILLLSGSQLQVPGQHLRGSGAASPGPLVRSSTASTTVRVKTIQSWRFRVIPKVT